MKAWKWIGRLLVAGGLVLGLCGCESGGGQEELAITGDSGLRVNNEMYEAAAVSFDNQPIGNVEGLSSRYWAVPSGRHWLQVGPNRAEYDFQPGATVTVRFHGV